MKLCHFYRQTWGIRLYGQIETLCTKLCLTSLWRPLDMECWLECSEIFTEKPSNLKARAQMFPSYKHNYEVFDRYYTQGIYLFPIKRVGRPQKWWTQNSDFLENLLPGDIVLADRGFDIQESVSMLCAEVKLPAFTRGRCQLAAGDVEETRKISHLRIHAERVIKNQMFVRSIKS